MANIHSSITVHKPEEIGIRYRWDSHNYPVVNFKFAEGVYVTLFPRDRADTVKLIQRLQKDLDLINDQLSTQEEEEVQDGRS